MMWSYNRTHQSFSLAVNTEEQGFSRTDPFMFSALARERICPWPFGGRTSASLACSITLFSHSVHTTVRIINNTGSPRRIYTHLYHYQTLKMSTQSEQYHSYGISIRRESNPPDAATLIGSGDYIVRWLDGGGRRYKDLGDISDCLALLDIADLRAAIRTATILETYISYDHGHLPSEGEPYVGSTGVTLSTATDYV